MAFSKRLKKVIDTLLLAVFLAALAIPSFVAFTCGTEIVIE